MVIPKEIVRTVLSKLLSHNLIFHFLWAYGMDPFTDPFWGFKPWRLETVRNLEILLPQPVCDVTREDEDYLKMVIEIVMFLPLSIRVTRLFAPKKLWQSGRSSFVRQHYFLGDKIHDYLQKRKLYERETFFPTLVINSALHPSIPDMITRASQIA